jgi:aminoglycoside phosphotransferase (APT) family kinase protein
MLEGETDYSHIVAELDRADPQHGRARLLHKCAAALAAIHRLKVSTQVPPRAHRLESCRRQLDEMDDASATFERAFGWLITHQPPPSPEVLVHGDYLMGNLLVDGTELRAVLDWEGVRVGEANEDLARFCARPWRFGDSASLGAGGLGSIESFLRAYQQTSGTTIDLAGFHWWRVIGTLLWGSDQLFQSSRYQIPPSQRAILGGHVREAEGDLLNLLDGKPIDDLGQPPPRPPDSGISSQAWRDLLA